MADCRLIIDPPLSGPWNMGVDEALLMDAVENSVPTLRFYQWSEPTLSLGYFQRYEDREQHAASLDCAVVRRQSGGGAILHDRELTYSLALPASLPVTRQAERIYTGVHKAFIAAISSACPTGNASGTLRIRSEEAQASPSDEPFLCFQRHASGDVIWGASDRPAASTSSPPADSPAQVWKVLGSAQRRHRGAILQHGSLLLEESPAAPELPGLCNLNGVSAGIDPLIVAVCAELADALSVRLTPSGLTAGLQSKAAELANNKYASAAWAKRR